METRFFSDVEPNMLAAGFGAAKHLSSQGYSVTLIDVSPNPGGLSAGWRTEQGRAVEAGVKGFWYQVHCWAHICIHWFWGCIYAMTLSHSAFDTASRYTHFSLHSI